MSDKTVIIQLNIGILFY